MLRYLNTEAQPTSETSCFFIKSETKHKKKETVSVIHACVAVLETDRSIILP